MKNEATDRNDRLRQLKSASWGAKPPSIELTFNYKGDAADDELQKLWEGIILAGVNYIRDFDYNNFFGGREMVSVLKEKGIASVSQALPREFVSEVCIKTFEDELSDTTTLSLVVSQTKDTMKDCIAFLLEPVDEWPRKRAFLDDFALKMEFLQKAAVNHKTKIVVYLHDKGRKTATPTSTSTSSYTSTLATVGLKGL